MKEISLNFRFKTPYIIKSGFGYAGIFDDTMLRDGSGFLYIPGSSIKGRIRAHMQKLLRSTGESFCSDEICKDRSHLCIMCRLFGSPFTESPLIFTDSKLTDKQKKFFSALIRKEEGFPFNLDTTGFASTPITRKRLTALKGGLHITELPLEGLEFQSRIIGDISDQDIKKLINAISLITHLGGNKGRGVGRLTDDGIKVEVINEIKT